MLTNTQVRTALSPWLSESTVMVEVDDGKVDETISLGAFAANVVAAVTLDPLNPKPMLLLCQLVELAPGELTDAANDEAALLALRSRVEAAARVKFKAAFGR